MKKYLVLSAFTFYSALLSAQETDPKRLNSKIRTHDERWYASPWIWIVGAAFFILLLVAFTSNRKKS